MTTMNVSLPDDLKAFVDDRVAQEGYGSVSEYFHDLIREAQRWKPNSPKVCKAPPRE